MKQIEIYAVYFNHSDENSKFSDWLDKLENPLDYLKHVLSKSWTNLEKNGITGQKQFHHILA